MAQAPNEKLSWMQRIALVRYSLHSGTRTGDFTFFKMLQAQMMLESSNCVAALQSALGEDADMILHALDDLSAGIAYVHQDSFKAVYDSVRSSISEDKETRLAKVCVDTHQQKQRAEFAIDKMASSVVELVYQQPPHAQDSVAAVWVMGITIIVDAVKVCVDQLDGVEQSMDDFVRLEYGWHTVQTAVEASVSAIRGIFSLMAGPEGAPPSMHTRSASVSSMASSTSSVLKRLSSALFHPPTAHSNGSGAGSVVALTSSRNPSFSSSSGIRASVSAAHPDHVPAMAATSRRAHHERRLSTIPPTPFGPPGEEINPFEMSFEGGSGSLGEIFEMSVPPLFLFLLCPSIFLFVASSHATTAGQDMGVANFASSDPTNMKGPYGPTSCFSADSNGVAQGSQPIVV